MANANADADAERGMSWLLPTKVPTSLEDRRFLVKYEKYLASHPSCPHIIMERSLPTPCSPPLRAARRSAAAFVAPSSTRVTTTSEFLYPPGFSGVFPSALNERTSQRPSERVSESGSLERARINDNYDDGVFVYFPFVRSFVRVVAREMFQFTTPRPPLPSFLA